MRIAIVEDELSQQTLLIRTLEQQLGREAAVHCQGFSDGLALQKVLRRESFDLVILDWSVPGMDGLELLRWLRVWKESSVPVLMISSRGAEDDVAEALNSGADDYITKPFSTQEMLARIRAVLRRRAPEVVTERVEIGELALDTSTHRVTWQGNALKVGPTEFKLLAYLMQHAERVHSRAQLLDKVWGDHVYIEERTVDVHVKRLRESLGAAAPMVETVRGAGYRLTAQVTV